MSFKSKQRAKHGHLFGDDPLNAALVSTSDDPLFASSTTTPSSKTSQSSRTNSPILGNSDPLSRNASPLDASSSTPISPRRSTVTKNTSSSIFGDIDVSKLGTAGNGGLYNVNSKRTSTTSLRSTGLRSSRQFDEDEEDLFGGGRVSKTRVLSKATSPTPSVTSSSTSAKKTSPIVDNDALAQQEPELTIPAPRKATPSPPLQQPSVQVTPATPSAKSTTTKLNSSSSSINETVAEKTDERPASSSSSSSFFATASRFFKSSSSDTNSKASSAASSIASVNNATSTKVEKQVEEEEEGRVATPPPPPPRQQAAPSQPKQQKQQQKQIPTLKSQLPLIIDARQVQQIEEDEEEEEDVPSHPIIEDEATRAFADDVISFQPTKRPDYISLVPDLSLLASMDSLRLDTTTPKRLLPSASTPTATTADVDDPWFDGALAAAAAATVANNTHSHRIIPPPHMLLVEPSMSSPPIQQQQQHRVLEKDIEPEKRSAFADLISSWNTGHSLNDEKLTKGQGDSEQFFNHVAEEQRDIGFAGISATVDDDENEGDSTRRVVIAHVWDSNEENPWN